MNPKTYEDNFFEYHLQGAINSAKAVIPIVKEFITPSSLVDIGCGIGAWLSIWKESGVTNILGIDGEYVNTTQLLIGKSDFKAINLQNNFTLDKRYDLATSLEVAEHLSASSAQSFIDSLCILSDVILFSAAIPSQEGTLHINEQYPGYWENIFRQKGYIPIDCIRQRVWNNSSIQWWYRQNMLFYVKETSLNQYPKLKEASAYSSGSVLPLIHPEMLEGKQKKINYYEEILGSSKITLKYFFTNLFKKKKI